MSCDAGGSALGGGEGSVFSVPAAVTGFFDDSRYQMVVIHPGSDSSTYRGLFIQEVIHPGAPWTWHNIPHPVNL